MIINPVFILAIVYFAANVYAFLNAVGNGGFEAFGYFHTVATWELILVIVLQATFLLGLFVFFKINSRKYRYVDNTIEDSVGYFLVSLTIAYFAFSQYYGVGIAGC